LLTKKVKATIEKYGMIEPGSAVLVAVSGGPDSVALLHLLSELREPLNCDLRVAHLNHGVRGPESDADEAFVRELAAGLGLEIVVGRTDAPSMAEEEGLSLEEACRNARRRFLLETARRAGCPRIATGHHSNDQAETVLLRLIRGAGVTGLAAIRPVTREGFVRPLLECGRGEILDFLAERKLPFREDSSNLDTTHLRNRVRRELIPLLEMRFNPSIVEVLCRTSRNMAHAEVLLSRLGLKALEEARLESERDRMTLDLKRLGAYDENMWGYIFRAACIALAGNSHGLTHEHFKALGKLVGKRSTGAVLHLPRGLRARRGYGVVEVYREKPRPRAPRFRETVSVPGLTPAPDLGGLLETQIIDKTDFTSDLKEADPCTEFFDLGEISLPLTLRTRKHGDRIRPFGLDGTKKLKDLLIELKVPIEARDRLPVLSDGMGVLWIAGLKRSDRAKILPGTKKVLTARWLKAGGSE